MWQAPITHLVIFHLLTFFCFPIEFWGILTAASQIHFWKPSLRAPLFYIIPFALVFFNTGFLPAILGGSIFLSKEFLNASSLVLSCYCLLSFIVYQVFYCIFAKFFTRYQLTILSFGLFFLVLSIRVTQGSFTSDFLKLFSFFYVKQFFTLIMASEYKNKDLRTLFLGNLQLWSNITAVPISIRILKKNEHPSTNLALLVSANKLLALNMFLGFCFVAAVSFIRPSPIFDFENLFQYRNGMTFPALKELMATKNITSNWLGLFLIGITVFGKITISANYAVCIARVFGYSLPATFNRFALEFKNFRELFRGVYYYYNYYILKIFIPRTANLFGRRNPRRQIFLSFWLGGIFYTFINHEIILLTPWGQDYFFTLFYKTAFFQALVAALVIYSGGLFLKEYLKNKYALWVYRIWLVWIFCLILLFKTTARYQNWSLMDYWNYLRGLWI